MKIKSTKELERLKKTLSIQTASNEEERMIEYIKSFISEKIPEATVVLKDKNIYVVKGSVTEGEHYPCMVAHTDTVHSILKDFSVFQQGDLLFAFSEEQEEQVGIGGDDKSGIWIALEMLLKKDTIKGVFFWGEEIGCQGSSKADKSFFDDVGYCIQCDRRGNADFVTSIYSDNMVSKEFSEVVNPIIKRHGYKEEDGMVTDVYELKESIDISMVNMSCGYYSPHTDTEVVSIKDSIDCMIMVDELIVALGLVKYEHEMTKMYSHYGRGWSSYNGFGTARYDRDSSKQNGYIDTYDLDKSSGGDCFQCYSDKNRLTIGRDIDVEFCPYCDVEWVEDEISAFSQHGRHVGRITDAQVYNRGDTDIDITDYYYCSEEENIYKWDELTVYTDDDIMTLKKRHNYSEPYDEQQTIISYD